MSIRAHQCQPLAGWSFELLVRLDMVSPGILAQVCRMRPERRLGALCVLAKQGRGLFETVQDGVRASSTTSDFVALQPLAKDIRRLSARELIEKYFDGVCPDGFLGALRKLQFSPGSDGPDVLLGLHGLFRDRQYRHVTNVLRALPNLTSEQIDAVATLDPAFLVPRFAGRVRRAASAHRLNSFLRLFRERAPELLPSLMQSISDIDPKMTIAAWSRRWAIQLPLPRTSVSPPGDFQELDTGQKLRDAGLRTRTCLGTLDLFTEILQGTRAYFESQQENAVVEVAIVGGRSLVLWKVHGPDNRPVSMVKRMRIERAFLACGVATFSWCPPNEAAGIVRKLAYEFDDLGDLEDAVTMA